MCFTKSAPTIAPVEVQEPVVRHEANAQATKNSRNYDGGFKRNVLTSAYGIDQEAKTTKKTLLGE